MFSPLRITAHLQTPVVSDASLPIDGILYYYAHRDAHGEQIATLPGAPNVTRGEHVPIPLKERNRKDKRGRWYYASSWAQWSEPVALGTDHWVKRFDSRHSDLVDFGGKRGKVIVEAGTYKAYHMPVFVRHSLTVTWYAVGDAAEIRRLLTHATNLGKKAAQGYGAVLRWEVESWHEDWSERDPDGRLMRPIPSERGVLIGYRPSYWLPKNQGICEVPE